MVFSALENADEYLPGLWDFDVDADARATWADRLATHLDDTLTYAREQEPPATVRHLEAVAPAWTRVIETLADASRPAPGRTVLDLVRTRDALFRGDEPAGGTVAPGPVDVFRGVKDRSNEWALPRYPAAIEGAGGGARALTPERVERAIAGILAGNVLDVASREVAAATSAGEDALAPLLERVRRKARGRIHASRVADVLAGVSGDATVLLFVDNAGMDFVLGVLPFTRLLARSGCHVVLGANERPALNDVTAVEAERLVQRASGIDPVLAELVASGRIRVVSTGNGTPGIDLRDVSPAVNEAEPDAVVLVGQGRAIESTWTARLCIPSIRIATLKSPLVAGRLGLEAFDVIVETRAAGECNPATGSP